MAWEAIQTCLSERVHHYKISSAATQQMATFAEVIALWNSDSAEGKSFRAFTTTTLCDSPFNTFRWETPVVDQDRFDRAFEFVLVDAPRLDRKPSRKAFFQFFEGSANEEVVIAFPNIGRNAVLVVPCPYENTTGAGGAANYCNLSSYLRTAPRDHSDQLWQRIGKSMTERVSDKPVWLNTAGGGVAWLHIRLDDRPKYYSYIPFKSAN